jgi:DNA polymerase-3 subunit delta
VQRFLVIGGDPWLVEREYRKIRSKIKKETSGELEVVDFSPCNFSADRLWQSLRNQSLFAANQLIVVQGAESLLRRPELEKLLKKVKSLSHIYLVLLTEQVKQSHWLVRLAQEKGAWRKVSLSKGHLKKLVEQEFKKRGCAVDSEAVGYLVEVFSDDLSALFQEVEKVSLYWDKKAKKLPLEKLKELVCASGRGGLFEFFKAVDERDRIKALVLLESLLGQEKPNYILYQLTQRFRQVFKLKVFMEERRISSRQAAAELGLHPYYAQKLAETSRNFSLNELENKLEILLRAEVALKTGQEGSHLFIERLISQIL